MEVVDESEIDDDVQVTVDVHAYSAELYDALCQACSGDALAVIRTVDDMKGFEAWAKLFRKFSPRTMARAIRLVGAVTNPPKVKDLKDAEAALDRWEEQVKALKKDFKETFSDVVKVGIVTGMMPLSIQEFVYTAVGDKIDYDMTVQKIRALVSNKVAMAEGPVPMDIGRVDGEDVEARSIGEDFEGYGEVDAIGNVQCHQCGGWGHVRRDCPSKGKGKGKGKDGGKGGVPRWPGKGGGNTWTSGKSGGKGFWGKCFKCGEVGHRKADCVKAAASVEDQGEGSVQYLETVWTVGCVAREDDVDVEPDIVPAGQGETDGQGQWQVRKDRRPNRRTRFASGFASKHGGDCRHPGHPCSTELGNRFQELAEINHIDGKEMTRTAELEFNEADVRKPLASARFVAKAGNGIWLDATGGYIENLATGEKMAVRVVNDVYVFDVELDDDTHDVVTLDSGAGCSVWPKGRHAGRAKMQPKKAGVGMVAANGTPIEHYGQRKICFKGVKAESPVFSGRT